MSGLPRAVVAAAGDRVDCRHGRIRAAAPSQSGRADAAARDGCGPRRHDGPRGARQVRLSEGLHTNSNRPRDPLLIPIVLSFRAAGRRDGRQRSSIPQPTDLKQEGIGAAAGRLRARVQDRRADGRGRGRAARRARGSRVASLSGVRRESVLSAGNASGELDAARRCPQTRRSARVNAAALKTIRFGTGEPPAGERLRAGGRLRPANPTSRRAPFTSSAGRIERLQRHWNGRRLSGHRRLPAVHHERGGRRQGKGTVRRPRAAGDPRCSCFSAASRST